MATKVTVNNRTVFLVELSDEFGQVTMEKLEHYEESLREVMGENVVVLGPEAQMTILEGEDALWMDDEPLLHFTSDDDTIPTAPDEIAIPPVMPDGDPEEGEDGGPNTALPDDYEPIDYNENADDGLGGSVMPNAVPVEGGLREPHIVYDVEVRDAEEKHEPRL